MKKHWFLYKYIQILSTLINSCINNRIDIQDTRESGFLKKQIAKTMDKTNDSVNVKLQYS